MTHNKTIKAGKLTITCQLEKNKTEEEIKADIIKSFVSLFELINILFVNLTTYGSSNRPSNN